VTQLAELNWVRAEGPELRYMDIGSDHLIMNIVDVEDGWLLDVWIADDFTSLTDHAFLRNWHAERQCVDWGHAEFLANAFEREVVRRAEAA